ncbi:MULTISPECIES: TRAP transporter large permease [unclassified Marinobacter]|jgi:tripartite ATP-independent transporter DctM subunit|uniref:TRAP transporter large permease n=1 Tax=unclassified Marinobacter TaxID=83889 RepID=UPI00200DD025|nr:MULTISPECIES: TRAP transporter large permease [unclassified Marinobacter]UQG55145.1 TRAP transporter large permease [Marinobacter sp. M4C]UQG63947.1 TRAP transporter large permease [Marinobacter sp. M2C]UQG68230.1 TRAP transporter large permease [Marinobacter sp. M1C]
MSELEIGALLFIVTFVVLFAGVPIAFSLVAIAVGFLATFGGAGALSSVAHSFVNELSSFALLALPMFVLVGAAIGMSPAGKDLYESLHRWFCGLPGGLVIANIFGCGLFSAMSGSSPATAATIGKVGIPEMVKRGVPARLAAGSIASGGTLGILIPPSITLIVYGIVTQTSIGRLFLAGVVPGLLLVFIFAFYAWLVTVLRLRATKAIDSGPPEVYSLKEKVSGFSRTMPFLLVIAAITFFMYGGYATPSEVAAVAAFMVIVLVALIYRIYRLSEVWPIMASATRDSTMILMIVAGAALYAYMMSYLYLTQSVADWMFGLNMSKWELLIALNVFLLIAGLFLPAVSIILMSMPIIYPVLDLYNIDLIWFAIVMTINLEIGMITPPLGLNLFIIRGIAPDITMKDIMLGSLPFVFLMLAYIVFLVIFPEIITWLPDMLMGPG